MPVGVGPTWTHSEAGRAAGAARSQERRLSFMARRCVDTALYSLGLLPFPGFAVGVAGGVDFEFKDSGDAVEAFEARGGGGVDESAAVADGSVLAEGSGADGFPGDEFTFGGAEYALAFGHEGAVGAGRRGISTDVDDVGAEEGSAIFEGDFDGEAGGGGVGDAAGLAIAAAFADEVSEHARVVVPEEESGVKGAD